jgi:pyruvate dehydrogenase E2 component (dihydrolipoamide acetyltransferase)
MTELRLQQLSIAMEDGKILRWLVADGERVAKGDVVVEVETDKATIEVEAPDDGTLRIIASEGAIVPVDALLGEVGAAAPVNASDRPAAPEALEPERHAAALVLEEREAGQAPIASPAARRIAAEQGIELASVEGTGPGGRIVARDLGAAAIASPPAIGSSSELRQAVVRNIVASWQQIPHVQVGGELAADGILAARELVASAGVKVTVTDLLVLALARALVEVAELNGTLGPGGAVERSGPVHLSLAVATNNGVAPVLRDAGSRPLEDIAAERARLVTAARDGSLDRRELAGGTVTLSNLGAYPVDFFAPVVSGPQIAMVATGRVAEKPVAEGGWIAVRARMWANVAVDHRAADGEAAGRLLAALERQLTSLPGGLA